MTGQPELSNIRPIALKVRNPPEIASLRSQ